MELASRPFPAPSGLTARSCPACRVSRRPDKTHHAFLAAALAQLGDKTAAAAHAQEVLTEEPAFSSQRFLSTLHYRLESDRDHLREGLLKAGLPE